MNDQFFYEQKTKAIIVQVKTAYLRDQSAPAENYYVWSYDITVRNSSNVPVQLLSRYWHIIDEQGNIQEVRGAGVVGKQPLIRPNEEFEYTSYTMLSTENGSMLGSYEMETVHGEKFDVFIPEFKLQYPCTLIVNNKSEY